MMHMHEYETPFASLVISILMLQYISIWSTTKLSNSLLSKANKSLCFYGQFNSRSHNSSKLFYETFVKLVPYHWILESVMDS
jgi:hypothetical protein